MLDKALNLARLTDCGVVAIIRTDSADRAVQIGLAAAEGGVAGVEVTLTTPDGLSAVKTLCARLGDRAVVGAGTVLNARECGDALEAGAKFIVSPNFDVQVLKLAGRSGAVCIPGAFSPTEILAAHRAGADVVKLFPSTSVGPTYAADILRPLPFLKLMPTGGVTLQNVAEWIKAGVAMVGVFRDLAPAEAVGRADWSEITRRAAAYVAAVKAARG